MSFRKRSRHFPRGTSVENQMGCLLPSLGSLNSVGYLPPRSFWCQLNLFFPLFYKDFRKLPGPESRKRSGLSKVAVTATKPWSTAWMSALRRTRGVRKGRTGPGQLVNKLTHFSGISSLPFQPCTQGVHRECSLRVLRRNRLHMNRAAGVHRELGCDNLPFPRCLHDLWAQGSILLFPPETLCENT